MTTKSPSQLDTYSEEYRHQCQVRSIIKMRLENRERALIELNGDGKRWPGWKVKSPKVYEDVLKQWRLGNRGEKGDWRE